MKEKDNGFLILVVFAAALGGLLFGFDTAVISGAVPFIKTYFDLDDIALGWAVSSLLAGCIVGVIASGKPADVWGRRKTLLVASLLFLISAIGSALSNHLYVFVVFRFIGGIAVGTASMLSPMYISEISPAAKRGSLVSLNQLAIVIGILGAFFSNYILVSVGDNNWRWMLAVMGVPALFFFVTLLFIPESPRWLVQKGKKTEAYSILERINGTEPATVEMKAVEQSIAKEEKGSYKEVFSKKMSPLIRMGIVVAVFSQVTGINSIMYYAPMIFAKTGIGIGDSLMQTIAVGGVNLIFTFVAIKYIDKFGRKPLLIAGCTGMAISLVVLAVAFHLHEFGGFLILASILIYIASFAASVGPVTWVFIAEIYPNRLRSEAMSVAVVFLWAAVFLVSLTFPYLLNALGGGTAFLVFGLMCVVYLVFLITKIPETKGKSLEELERILIKE
ncbi:MAG: sugar porter family MFS transporter [Ignavibacteriales bacterium]|nr:sugar porter family MFS transporter [Ignavibacteriales bacterium]